MLPRAVGTVPRAATFGFALLVVKARSLLALSGGAIAGGQLVEAGVLGRDWLVAVRTIIEVTMAAARNPKAHAGEAAV